MNINVAAESQIHRVTSFRELVSTPFAGEMNAICWTRNLVGDFSEIVEKLKPAENLVMLEEEELRELTLSAQGQLAREILLQDLKLLTAHGASPILNLIKYYERDDAFPFFPTDVYSFHVDSAPVPVDTFLCTYHGDSSDILPYAQAEQKILIPELRAELRKVYNGPENGFESFLKERSFQLHYQAKPSAKPINLGLGNMWRLAVDHPEKKVQPCIHRAPEEKTGQTRLMMIC